MEYLQPNEFNERIHELIQADNMDSITLSELKWWIVNACKYIVDMQASFAAVVSNITLNTRLLSEILNVSVRTIARWRQNRSLPYERKRHTVYYKFEDVYAAVCNDRLCDKRFKKEEGKMRLEEYQRKTVYSYMPMINQLSAPTQ